MELSGQAVGEARKMSKGRIKREAQRQIYFVEELIVFLVVVIALIAGVKFYGLGDLDSSFAILFRGGADLPLIRGVIMLVMLVVGLWVLNKKVGKPASGMPKGIGTYRVLSVLLIGGIVVWLVWSWMGK